MQLIMSPKLSKSDLDIIKKAKSIPELFIADLLCHELEDFENECIQNHVQVLGWMVANNKIEMKIALVYDSAGSILDFEQCGKDAIFHQKVGILKDKQGNAVSFSGSINESAKGWLENIEEFKVFREWIDVEREYYESDRDKFLRFWNNISKRVKTFDLPNSLKHKLIEIAAPERFIFDLNQWYKQKKEKITLHEHQNKALLKWIENGYNGIFEMATGTGKTFAALGCLNEVFKNKDVDLSVIACPYQHLVQQWKKEIGRFGLDTDQTIIADSSNQNWKKELTDAFVDVYLGHRSGVIVLTTHATFSSNDFRKIISKEKNNRKILLIADEVHGIGAEKIRLGMVDAYELRLGLSATPKRWFDDVGTNSLYEYFKGIVYEFGLEDAINTVNPSTGETYLTPYRYKPKFVTLTGDELSEYVEMSRVIAFKFFNMKSKEEKDIILENLLFKRANIVKNANNKFVALEEILHEIGSIPKWLIIYCTPQQIDKITSSINIRGVIVHRFTMEEGTTPSPKFGGFSEREDILEKFAQGKYQALVAMKCLDEGVDVPPARTAILMGSSGNPREYIQRIGRILRRFEGKTEAVLYDVIVVPSFKEICMIAINSSEAIMLLDKTIDRLHG